MLPLSRYQSPCTGSTADDLLRIAGVTAWRSKGRRCGLICGGLVKMVKTSTASLRACTGSTADVLLRIAGVTARRSKGRRCRLICGGLVKTSTASLRDDALRSRC
jgi:hypothetical protein